MRVFSTLMSWSNEHNGIYFSICVYRFVACSAARVLKVLIMLKDYSSLVNHIFTSSMASQWCLRRKSRILIPCRLSEFLVSL